jgi:hypothetical protein
MRHIRRSSLSGQAVRGALTVALLVGVGCTRARDKEADLANGDRPLDALTANVASTRYGDAYWARQSDSNTAVWQEAKAYCERSGVTAAEQKVNCGPVMAARYEETARHPERRKPGDLRP